jgi:hypothetical protein
MIKKTKRIRRKRSKGKSSKEYFGIDTHNAIKEFQHLESFEDKHSLYILRILPAFDKLVENLIFIHGFAKGPVIFEVLKSDCVTFLYETIHKFDPDRGTKAFSYFNVVAKNWLIIQSKKQAKMRRRTVSIESDLQESNSIDFYDEFSLEPQQDKRIIRQESIESLNKLLLEIKNRLKTEKEMACIDAIISLFSRVDDLELLNKRAIFVYLRDISSLSPKQLSVTMSTIRKHYRDISGRDEYELFLGL